MTDFHRFNNSFEGQAQFCPQCLQSTLRRIHRTKFDHFIGRLGVPVRRYFCTNCHWEGRKKHQGKAR